MATTRVRVRVQMPPDVAPPADGRVRVTVEEVSRADAAAGTTALAVFPVTPARARELGPYELVTELPPGGSYAVRVHVDRSGDGRIVAGDLVSVARHEVRPDAPGVDVVVPVRTVAPEPPRRSS